MELKKVLVYALSIGLITSCSSEPKEEHNEETVVEQTQAESKAYDKQEDAKMEISPFEEISKFVFGDDVKTDIIEIQDENNNPKVTRVNISDSGEAMENYFLTDVYSYLKKVKEQELDYESIFFTLKSKKTNNEEYPYVKIEVTKDANDKFDFTTKNPQDLISIAKTYDSYEDKETTGEVTEKKEITTVDKTNNSLTNDDTKAIATSFIKSQFEDMCDVYTETQNGTFVIHLYPKDSDLKAEIAGLMIDNTNPDLIMGWEMMSEGILELSKSVKDQVDENVSIMLHNPINDEMILFATINDAVLVDFLNE